MLDPKERGNLNVTPKAKLSKPDAKKRADNVKVFSFIF
jgi:hypothetical protein